MTLHTDPDTAQFPGIDGGEEVRHVIRVTSGHDFDRKQPIERQHLDSEASRGLTSKLPNYEATRPANLWTADSRCV